MAVSSEQRLQEVFQTVAAQVQTSPDAYRKVRAEWRRRERRRRLIVAVLAAAVIAAADGIALWALSDATPDQHIIFNDPVDRVHPLVPGGHP